MKILIGYDGSKSADAAIAAAGKLLAGADAEAIVLSVWEPESVAAVRAARFGGPMLPISNDAADDDDRSEQQARKLAEHGARLARILASTPHPCGWQTTATSRANRRRGDRTRRRSRRARSARSAGVRAFLGSVSNHVLQHCQRPVLIIPALATGERSEPRATRGRRDVVQERALGATRIKTENRRLTGKSRWGCGSVGVAGAVDVQAACGNSSRITLWPRLSSCAMSRLVSRLGSRLRK